MKRTIIILICVCVVIIGIKILSSRASVTALMAATTARIAKDQQEEAKQRQINNKKNTDAVSNTKSDVQVVVQQVKPDSQQEISNEKCHMKVSDLYNQYMFNDIILKTLPGMDIAHWRCERNTQWINKYDYLLNN